MNSPYKKIIGAFLVVAMAGGGLVAWVKRPNPPSTVMNEWVAASAGASPQRCSPACGFNSTHAFGSVAAAAAAAQGGDQASFASNVTVPAGAIVTAIPSGSSNLNRVTFTMPAGTQMDGYLQIQGSNMNFQDFVWCCQNSNSKDATEQFEFSGSGSNLSMINPDSSAFQTFGTGVNNLIDHGDIGPCYFDTADAPNICLPRVFSSNTADVTIKRSLFHDMYADSTPGACGSDTCHTDGLAVFGGNNTVIDGNQFIRTAIADIRIQNCCGVQPQSIVLRNNFFGPNVNAALPAGDSTVNPTRSINGVGRVDFDSNIPNGLTIEHNSFYIIPNCTTGITCGTVLNGCDVTHCTAVPGSSPSRQEPNGSFGTGSNPAIIRGNLLTLGSSGGHCSGLDPAETATAIFTYNRFHRFSNVDNNISTSSPCGSATNARDEYNSNWPYASDPALVISTLVANPEDLHITGGAWPGDSWVGGVCPSFDIDGGARTSPCDVGADERALVTGASQATCSPSTCAFTNEVSHVINAPDSNAGGPLPVQNVDWPYYTMRPTNLVGNAPLFVALDDPTSTASGAELHAATNRYEVLRLPVWNRGAVAVPTIQSRDNPQPAPRYCGVGGDAAIAAGQLANVCDNIPAIKAAIDATIAAGGVDTSRIYIGGASKQGLETQDAICDPRTTNYFTGVVVVSDFASVQQTVGYTNPGDANQLRTPPCPASLGTDHMGSGGNGIGGPALSPPNLNYSLMYMYGTFDTTGCTSSNNAPGPDCLTTGWIDNQNRWTFSAYQVAGDSNPPNGTGATGRPSGGSSVGFGAKMGCNGTASSIINSGPLSGPNGTGSATTNIYTGCTNPKRATAVVRVINGGHANPGLDGIGFDSWQAEWDFFAAYGGP